MCDAPKIISEQGVFFTHLALRTDGPPGSGIYVPRGPAGPLITPSLINFIFLLGFLQLLFFLISWLTSLILQIIQQVAEQHIYLRNLGKSDPSTIVQKRLRKFLIYSTLAFFPPELVQELIKNISNRWVRVLIRSLLPVIKFLTLSGLWLSIGFIGIDVIRWLNLRLILRIEKLVMFVTYFVGDLRIIFLELFIKSLLCSFFAGGLCRVVFSLCRMVFKCDFKNIYQSTGKSVVMAVVQIGGLYYIFTTGACLKLAQTLIENYAVIAFFVNSQLNRWVLIIVSLRILMVMDPYTGFCFFVVTYLFRLFVCASTITPNIF